MRYRKKQIEIEAEEYRIGLEDGFDTIGIAITNGYKGHVQPKCAEFKGIPYINTLEGRHYISEGDYIITGVKGERYPCKSDIFELTYEKVNE